LNTVLQITKLAHDGAKLGQFGGITSVKRRQRCYGRKVRSIGRLRGAVGCHALIVSQCMKRPSRFTIDKSTNDEPTWSFGL